MLKKPIVFTFAMVMLLAILAAGCGNIGKSSIEMEIPDEKTAAFEFNRASVDDFVQAGYISVAEGEGIEVVSNLNDGGKVLIGLIAVPESQNIDELPDMDTKYEMMISEKATQGATLEPGEYDLKVTVQGKTSGNVTLRVKPVKEIIGMEGAK